MFEKDVLVAYRAEDLQFTTIGYCEKRNNGDIEWFESMYAEQLEVIAWMPIPEYKESEQTLKSADKRIDNEVAQGGLKSAT